MKGTLQSFYAGETVALNFDDASINISREDVRQLGGFFKIALETHAKKNHDEIDLKGMSADSKLFLKAFEKFHCKHLQPIDFLRFVFSVMVKLLKLQVQK